MSDWRKQLEGLRLTAGLYAAPTGVNVSEAVDAADEVKALAYSLKPQQATDLAAMLIEWSSDDVDGAPVHPHEIRILVGLAVLAKAAPRAAEIVAKGIGVSDRLPRIQQYAAHMKGGARVHHWNIDTIYRALTRVDQVSLECAFQGRWDRERPAPDRYSSEMVALAREWLPESIVDTSLPSTSAFVPKASPTYSQKYYEVN